MTGSSPSSPVTPIPSKGLAVLSFALGAAALAFSFGVACLIFAIPTVILGRIALHRAWREPQTYTGARLALAGVTLGAISPLIFLGSLWMAAPPNPTAAFTAPSPLVDTTLLSTCSNNMKSLGIVCKMYAGENRSGYLPELSPEPGNLAFISSIYPEYINDPSCLVCPARTPSHNAPVPGSLLNDESYFYWGYVLLNDEETEAFAEAYLARIAEGGDFADDLPAPPGKGSAGGDKFLRLREGVERFIITDTLNPNAARDAQSTIPVMVERVGSHGDNRGVILYMDGHVDSGAGDMTRWPLGERCQTALKKMDAAPPPAQGPRLGN